MAKRTNDDIREIIEECINDEEITNETILLEGDEFADGVVGYTEDGRLVYSYEKLVKSLADQYGSVEDAVDWLEFNTIRALPYMESQGHAPIMIHEITQMNTIDIRIIGVEKRMELVERNKSILNLPDDHIVQWD